MVQLNTTVAEVTQRIVQRSSSLRADYLRQVSDDHSNRPERCK